VLIVAAPSLIHVRLIARVRGLDGGAEFAGGHRLDAERSRKQSGF
jgi:hypothetical protein